MFAIAAGYYFYSTDRTSDTVLIGIVDANQVIVSSKIMGRVEKLYVDEGSKVKAGDLIAEIDSAELEAQKNAAEATINAYNSQVSSMQATEAQTLGETNSGVVNAQARLAAAKATLAQAKADLVTHPERLAAHDRSWPRRASRPSRSACAPRRRCNAQHAVVKSAQKNVDAAQADLNTANARLHQQRAAASNVAMNQAQVANAKAQLAEADTRLGYTKIYAPVSGTVSVRATRQGEVVNPGTPIVTIIDFSDTWVRAEAPETESRFIAVGRQAEGASARRPADRGHGDLQGRRERLRDAARREPPQARHQDHRPEAEGRQPDGELVPGMTAEVLLPKDLPKGKP